MRCAVFRSGVVFFLFRLQSIPAPSAPLSFIFSITSSTESLQYFPFSNSPPHSCQSEFFFFSFQVCSQSPLVRLISRAPELISSMRLFVQSFIFVATRHSNSVLTQSRSFQWTRVQSTNFVLRVSLNSPRWFDQSPTFSNRFGAWRYL